MQYLLLLTAISVAEPTDGSILYIQNSNAIVERYTKSAISHVGIVLNDEEGSPWVYEATPAIVRRVRLDDYRREIGDLNLRRRKKMAMWIRQPRVAYSDQESESLRRFLDSQLGRRYSIKGYVRGQESDGVHCAQLTAAALSQSTRFSFHDSHRLSPAKVVERILGQYSHPMPVRGQPTEPRPSWCARSQQYWLGLFGWCGWACGEAWSFCR